MFSSRLKLDHNSLVEIVSEIVSAQGLFFSLSLYLEGHTLKIHVSFELFTQLLLDN